MDTKFNSEALGFITCEANGIIVFRAAKIHRAMHTPTSDIKHDTSAKTGVCYGLEISGDTLFADMPVDPMHPGRRLG